MGHPPLWRIEVHFHFMCVKGRLYSRAIDNVMGVIHKNSESENIPDIGGKTDPSALFLNGGRKGISIKVVD